MMRDATLFAIQADIAIIMAAHPIDQSRNNSCRTDLTKVHKILKVTHQRIKLSGVVLDCIVICLSHSLVTRENGQITRDFEDSVLPSTAEPENKF